jgi:hypothetical protein
MASHLSQCPAAEAGGMSFNPKSLLNLQRGGYSPDPLVRQARARKGGLARAKQAMDQTRREILREYGPSGLALFQRGVRYQQGRKAKGLDG